jgi:hypothetical protein
MNQSTIFLLGASLAIGACSDSNSGAGTFPNVETLAAKVVPYVSMSGLKTTNTKIVSPKIIEFSPFAVDFTSGTTSNFDSDRVYIADVLGTNLTGVNTQIAVQMAQLQTQIAEINSSYSAEDGSPANCTETILEGTLDPDGGLIVPFFSSATSPVFWASPDNLPVDPTVTCYVQKETGGYDYGFIFGRTPISSPPSDCTDPYIYIIANGYSGIDKTNSSDTANRGNLVSGYQTQAIYYQGCTKDVGIAMSLSTKYTAAIAGANNEFNARFELFGNADTNEFQVRVNKFDGMKDTSWGFNSMKGAGKASGTGNFIMSMTRYNCNNEACASPTVGTATRNYCLALGSSQGAVEVDSTTTNCSAYVTNYEDTDLTLFTTGASTDLSRSILDFSTKAVFGL